MDKYNNYKNSKLEWIDKMPFHWKSSKLKWLSDIYAGGTPNTNNADYWEKGTIPWLNSGTVNQKRIKTPSNYITELAVLNSSTKWVPKGSLVMALAGQGKTKGIVAILEINATCNQSMAAIIPKLKEINNEFLFFWLDSNYQRIRGLAGSELRDGLNLEIIGDLPCPLPPLKEQIQIAKYLKHRTDLIDIIIKQKNELIDLLKEKQLVLISEAVTKGIESKPKMKHVSAEGLKKIPKDWTIKPLKRLISLKGRLGWKGLKAQEYVESGYGFLSTPDIKRDTIDFNTINFITEARYLESPEIMLELGDVLLVKDGSTLGIVNIIRELPIPATVNSSIGVLRVFDKKILNPNYLFWLIKSDYIQSTISKLRAGQGVPHLFQKDIKNFSIVLPPIEVQNRIIEFIENKNQVFNDLITKLSEEIKKLKEYHQSILLEVTTGKIDVRNWQLKTKKALNGRGNK
ncbi:MAG: restriction endonuclease subunit S [Bacteroidetes bacterium]|nr:restriction endonuclease subunit S [Bacteroidota bacterium]